MCVIALNGCMNANVEVVIEEVNLTLPLDDVTMLDDGCIEYTYEGVTDIVCEDYDIINGREYEGSGDTNTTRTKDRSREGK